MPSCPEAAPLQQQPACPITWLGRVKKRLKFICGAIRRSPLILIVPLALCAAILGVGLWFVQSANKSQISLARTGAQDDVVSAARKLEVGLRQAVMPVVQLADTVKHAPEYNRMYATWAQRANDWWTNAPSGAAMLRMSPHGVVVTVWPITPVSSALVGRNVLAGQLRNDSLEVIRNGAATTSGPNWVAGRYEMLIRIPIFIPNTTRDTTFNIPIPPPDCPEDLCWINSTKSKWWGFAVMDLDWYKFSSLVGQLDKLSNKYGFKIERPGDVFVGGIRMMDSRTSVDGNTDRNPPSDALTATLDVFGKTWIVYAWRDKWDDGRAKGYFALVIIISVLCAYMAFVIMLTRFEHLALLSSLLPSDAIDKALNNWRWSAQDDANEALVMLHQGTPAEAIMSIISDLLKGKEPSLGTITTVRSALVASADIYQPLAGDLNKRLASKNMDDEVHQALMNQLVGRAVRGLTTVNEEDEEAAGDAGGALANTKGAEGPQSVLGRKRRTSTGSAPSDDSLQALPTMQHVRQSIEEHSGPMMPTGAPDTGVFSTLHGALFAITQGFKGPGGIPSGTTNTSWIAAGRNSIQADSRLLQIGSNYDHGDDDPGRDSQPNSQFRFARTSLPQAESRNMLLDYVGDAQEDAQQHKGFKSSILAAFRPFKLGRDSVPRGSAQTSAIESGPNVQDRGSTRVSHGVELSMHDQRATPAIRSDLTSGTLTNVASVSVLLEASPDATEPRRRKPRPPPKRVMSEQLLTRVASPAHLQAAKVAAAYQEVPEKVLPSGLEAVLATANSWAFNAYDLEAASHGRPLSTLAFWLFHCTGVIDSSRLNRTKLARFLMRVEDAYLDNPYHNKRHAADVLQTMHVLLHRGGLVPGYADNTVVLASYLAAVVHDLEHLGRNNDFLITTQHDLAVVYNDKSPMENHHLAAAWYLLRCPDYNFMERMGKRSWARTRSLVVEMVLATDMKKHFQVIAQFSAVHRLAGHSTTSGSPSESFSTSATATGPKNSSRGARMSMDSDGRDSQATTSTMQIANKLGAKAHLVPISDSDQVLSLQMALKLADLGHLAAPLNTHLKWVGALEAEFFMQGDAEVAMGLPPSPLCDRNKTGVTKSQIGFFDFVAIPLFNNFSHRFPNARPLYKAMMKNYGYWQVESGLTRSRQGSNAETLGKTSTMSHPPDQVPTPQSSTAGHSGAMP